MLVRKPYLFNSQERCGITGYNIDDHLNCLSLKDADSLVVLSGPCDNLGAVERKYIKLPKLLTMAMQLS